MRRITALPALALTGVLALSACGSGEGEGGPVQLRFLSLAWQTQSIEANERLVQEWNDTHPDIQVEYVQGSWDNVNDQLLTGFEAGDPPDIIHNESSALAGYAARGYLADLGDMLPQELKDDIRAEAWETATFDGQVVGVPFLQESQVFIANREVLEDSGVRIPTSEEPWTWDEFAEVSEELTTEDRYAVAWPLGSPVNRVLNLSLNFGGTFFEVAEDGTASMRVGEQEREVLQRIHEQLYEDETAAPETVGMSGSDPLPAFYAGEYAMIQGGVYTRQQVVEQAPEDFEWVTIPPLVGDTAEQGAVSQTLSVAADSAHPEEAAEFLSFFLSAENQVDLALGDWLLPTSREAAQAPELNTEENDWDVATASADNLVMAPYLKVQGFDEWKNRVAQPALEEYFGGAITIDELAQRLETEGDDVLGRYR
ncbi:ABC-type glycerol-3-phosphate transport system substrate-binding protein [Spinactinospora alkalitolerans]|uniref:ABC-type glycerol-3-phosphate transport system substrate-binding protein n=1 Tax=Spinactinospora alkalitolerans TaxID=687207 RepID=A0A852TZ07_9ACTN|nr:sugar ABC transporter substrate-binding protein [Spinactinospora alkalitolerans]NYE47204.1 ABC-type glycerol-3-phosphate transport system substrate-binding protein [Spinactinospora alkalitolerans]